MIHLPLSCVNIFMLSKHSPRLGLKTGSHCVLKKNKVARLHVEHLVVLGDFLITVGNEMKLFLLCIYV